MANVAEPPKYRLNAKGVFLTYPQCPAPRETVKEMLEAKGLTILKGLIAQETHASGDLHLHAYAKFTKNVETRNPRYFDITWQDNVYHGKYEPAKSAIGSIKYLTKHDKEPLELADMDWKQELDAKKDKKRILGKRLADGEKLIDLIDDNN